MVVVLMCTIGSAALADAREPRYQGRPSGTYQTYNKRNTNVRVPYHRGNHYRQTRYAPERYVPVMVSGTRYFFGDGIFYRQGLYGYIAVQAPYGAVLVSLPIGSHIAVVGGARYHVYGGVYYRQVPQGYVVVEEPRLGDEYSSTDRNYEVPEHVAVIPRILNVREGPGKRHPVMYKVYRNDILKIITRADGWVFVQLPSGKSGWVMAEYITPVRPSAKG